jgi:hypothetical protein
MNFLSSQSGGHRATIDSAFERRRSIVRIGPFWMQLDWNGVRTQLPADHWHYSGAVNSTHNNDTDSGDDPGWHFQRDI